MHEELQGAKAGLREGAEQVADRLQPLGRARLGVLCIQGRRNAVPLAPLSCARRPAADRLRVDEEDSSPTQARLSKYLDPGSRESSKERRRSFKQPVISLMSDTAERFGTPRPVKKL